MELSHLTSIQGVKEITETIISTLSHLSQGLKARNVRVVSSRFKRGSLLPISETEDGFVVVESEKDGVTIFEGISFSVNGVHVNKRWEYPSCYEELQFYLTGTLNTIEAHHRIGEKVNNHKEKVQGRIKVVQPAKEDVESIKESLESLKSCLSEYHSIK